MLLFKRSFHSSITRQRSFYDILQLNERADKRTIKANYYKLSKKYHPDLNPNNKEAHKSFLEINEAYAILGNEASKKKYDYDRTSGSSSSDSHYTNPMAKYSRAGGSGGNTQAWHFRNRRPRSTGSTSAQEQAERMRTSTPGGGGFNYNEHFTKHYENEEHRRRQRVENAAHRRRAAGDDSVPGKKAVGMENLWGRLWRLGVVLTGIAYAAQQIS